MIDFESEVATVYWTYDTISAHKEWGFGDEIWIEDRLDSTVVTSEQVRFDAPAAWDYDGATLAFRGDDRGVWRYADGGTCWEGYRQDTPSHVLIVGIWREDGYRGTFVLVIPMQGGADKRGCLQD